MIEEKIDVNESLREIENFLRNNIIYILKNNYGDNWEDYLGVSKERIDIWNERMNIEKKRLNGQKLETRKLYYADFYDLKTIIIRNWNLFNKCFQEKKVIEHQLNQLESFRNPNAHNRDLLDYQKHLLLGYIGNIKNEIMQYRGNIEKISTFFPEYDSMNINGQTYKNPWAHISNCFRTGDIIEITIYVTTPNTLKVFFSICNKGESPKDNWIDNNHFTIIVSDTDIGHIEKNIYFKSDADYHMNNELEYDGIVTISFTAVPN